MGAADLYDAIKVLGLFCKGLMELFKGGEEIPYNGLKCGEVNGRRDHVVAGLAPIHVIIGVDPLAPFFFA